MGHMTPIVPCTPTPSCQRPRCHPQLPPCANPERCLKVCRSKNVKPCESAVQIMANRAKTKCSTCQMYKNPETVEMWLKRKDMEEKLKRDDGFDGTHKYLDYVRTKGSPKELTDCCAGHGHRGRLTKGSSCQQQSKQTPPQQWQPTVGEDENLTPRERRKRERMCEKAAKEEEKAKKYEARLEEKARKQEEKLEEKCKKEKAKAERRAEKAKCKEEILCKKMKARAAKMAQKEAINAAKNAVFK